MQITRKNRFLLYIAGLSLFLLLLGLAPRLFQASQEMYRAQQALQTGELAQAAAHIAKAAQLQPWRGDLWESAGHYALQAGQPAEAIAYLEEASRALQGGLTRQGWVDLGDAHRQNGDYASAAQAWQVVLTLESPSIETYERLLDVHQALGDYPAMIQDLQALVDLQPEQAQWHFQLGLSLATRQPESALDNLESAAELDSSLKPVVEKLSGDILAASLVDDPAYQLLAAGRALASLGEWELAAEAFHQAVLVNPDYAEAWAYLGEARQHLPQQARMPAPEGDGSQDGLTELQKALALDEESLSAHMFLSLYWSRQERYEQAEQVLHQAIDLYPRQAILQVALGDVLAQAGDLGGAYEAYLQAIQLAPGEGMYIRRLASFSLYYGFQIDQIALPAARQAVTLAPKDVESLDLLAQVLLQLGDLDSAERFLLRALEADLNYAPAHLHLGLIYLLHGDLQAALRSFQRVRELAPNSPLIEQVDRLLEAYTGGTLAP